MTRLHDSPYPPDADAALTLPTRRHPSPGPGDVTSPRAKALIAIAKAKAEAGRLVEFLDAAEVNLLNGWDARLYGDLAEEAASSALSVTINLAAYARRTERAQ